MFTYLTCENKEGVCWITFNRPEQLNAMNRALMDEIISAFQMANKDDEVRVIVVTGNGRAFMAGADIKEYASQTDVEFNNFQERGWELYKAAETSSKPYIAMVNGFALGGGFEIALACDLIIASKSAKFGLPEIHLGLVPGGGGTQKLVQKTGLNRVKEMLFFGGQFNAEEMLAWGIVNFLTEDDELYEFTRDKAQKLVRRLPDAIKQMKYLAQESVQSDAVIGGMKKEARALFELFHLPEVKQKLENFINK